MFIPLLIGLIGLLGGFIAGFFGIGGGIAMTPLLILLFNLNFIQAKSIVLFSIIFITPVGAYIHKKHGSVDIKCGLILGATGITGSIFGSIISFEIPENILEFSFGIIALIFAFYNIYQKERGGAEKKVMAYPIIGFSGGIISSIYGLGGGIVIVPMLIYSGFSVSEAIGTSLLSIFLIALAGSMVHHVYSTINYIFAIPLIAGLIIGVVLGSKSVYKIKEEKLKHFLTIMLFTVAIYMFFKGMV